MDQTFQHCGCEIKGGVNRFLTWMIPATGCQRRSYTGERCVFGSCQAVETEDVVLEDGDWVKMLIFPCHE